MLDLDLEFIGCVALVILESPGIHLVSCDALPVVSLHSTTR
jgi:hypothetical protein